jgi:ribosomal protein L11 methyltransferase
MESYVKIKLIAIPSELEEDITDHCFSSGSLGVSESLTFSQPDLTYEPDIVHTKKVDLDVFFNEMPAQTFFDGLLEIYPSLKWQSDVEATKDWLEEWKKGFVAFKLVGSYWIVPSWLEAPPEAEKTLQIDPGMAFGTGTHATTQMAAYFVSKICSQYKKDLSSLSLIDVGTGTAVLAHLAKMEGTGRVLGIEIDPEARRVAK